MVTGSVDGAASAGTMAPRLSAAATPVMVAVRMMPVCFMMLSLHASVSFSPKVLSLGETVADHERAPRV
ncbi:hypothetical protein GCM10027598_66750 [Amycolatopsis oliviviridis]|uniref:Secreted protein n=1 Tax=Amycolatopsis oliviviridis TaxID=1471590 RepID=A0ABQ3M2T6_9PSEU|nr:hypothetical protein GCM10017790_64000 [Amycolatopsis oliviviridis]